MKEGERENPRDEMNQVHGSKALRLRGVERNEWRRKPKLPKRLSRAGGKAPKRGRPFVGKGAKNLSKKKEGGAI